MTKFPFTLSPSSELLGREHTHSMFSSVAAGIAVILYVSAVVARIGTGSPPTILPLLLSLTLIILPHSLHQRSTLPLPFLQLLLLIFYLVTGWISILLNINLSSVIYVIFLLSAYLFFFRTKGVRGEFRMILKLVLILCLSMVLLKQVWTQNYLNPLAPEAYVGGNNFLHQDTFFLSSITGMIKTYQVASSGLFGLVPLTYHIGSNILFASLSQLCNLHVIEFYNIAYPIIFVPLLCQAMLYATVTNPKTKLTYKRVILTLVGLIFVLCELVGTRIGTHFYSPTSYNSQFLSQSYCISLILAFWTIAIYYPFLMRGFPLHKDRTIHIVLVLTIPLWIFLTGFSKISTGAMLLAVFLYLVVRRKLFIDKWVLASSVLSILMMIVIFYMTAETTDSTFTWKFGEYYKAPDLRDRIIPYLLLQYCWLMLFAIITFIFYKKNHTEVFRRLISGKLLLMELLLVTAVVGILPALFFNIESAGYFADVQYWFAAVAVVSVAPYFVFVLRKITPKVVTGLMVITIGIVTITAFVTFCRKNYKGRVAIVYGRHVDFTKLMKSANLRTLLSPLGIRLNESELYKLHVLEQINLPLFDSLRNLPPEIKSTSVIYCEDIRELRVFLECPAILFYTAAMSEMATINGLFWRECLPQHRYSLHLHANDPTYITSEQGYEFARQKGFKNVIVVNLGKHTYEIVKL
jgi:hypothetical protein